jgi:hypothetical protein
MSWSSSLQQKEEKDNDDGAIVFFFCQKHFKKRGEGKRLSSCLALLLSLVASFALLLSSSCNGDGKKSTVEVSTNGREVDGLGGGREVGR